LTITTGVRLMTGMWAAETGQLRPEALPDLAMSGRSWRHASDCAASEREQTGGDAGKATGNADPGRAVGLGERSYGEL
jgi:hypothetical protein